MHHQLLSQTFIDSLKMHTFRVYYSTRLNIPSFHKKNRISSLDLAQGRNSIFINFLSLLEDKHQILHSPISHGQYNSSYQ